MDFISQLPRYLRRWRVGCTIFGVGIFVFTHPVKVYSLSGVAAQFDRVSTGVSVFVSGRHAPSSELVIIDQNGEVIVSALDEGFGSFSFDYAARNDQLSNMSFFAVDAAASTRPVSVPSSGLDDILLPPSIVINHSVVSEENNVGVGGYTYPGANLVLNLEGDNGVFETEILEAESDGGWEYEFINILPGNYVAYARSEVEGLTSSQSFEVEIIVDDEDLPVVNEVSETVKEAVETVAEVILPSSVTDAAKGVTPEVEQVNRVVTPVASAGLATQVALIGRDLLYWLFQGITAMLQYFGFWRKRRPWGIVYDAYTKQPVMLATVRLYTNEQFPKLIETDVSSKAGVFSFFPESGKYLIKVAKSGYEFPSHLVAGSNDGEYGHVYHGEPIEFAGDTSAVEVSIPVDPAELEVKLRFKIVNFLRTRTYMFTLGMLVVGFLLSLIAVIGGGSSFNGFMLVFYTLVLTLQGYLAYRRTKAWGSVVDVNGEPVPGIQLSLMDPQFEKLVQRRVTNEKGEYQFVVPEGRYQIRVESVGHELITDSKRTYDGREIVVHGSRPRIVTQKIMVRPS